MAIQRFGGSIEDLVAQFESGSPKLDWLEKDYARQLQAIAPGTADAGGIAQAALAHSLRVKWEASLPEAVAAAKHLRDQGIIEHALKAVDEVHRVALHSAGLSSHVVELLKSWLDATVETRLLQRDIEFSRTAAASQELREAEEQTPLLAGPLAPLGADELGNAMGVSGETVRLREKANELFSILRPGRKRGREYPAFQAWTGVVGSPLKRVLAQLKPSDGFGAFAFFSSPNDLLLELTPIEVLAGGMTSSRSVPLDAQELLAASDETRLEAVLEAARTEASITHEQE